MSVQKLVFSSKIENGDVAVLVQDGRDPKTDVAPTYRAQRWLNGPS